MLAWFHEGAEALLGTLRSMEPGKECWTFGPKPRTAAFWFRRQALENVVHTWDAAASQGLCLPLDVRLSLDGIDEVVQVLFPRQVRLGRIPTLAGSLGLLPLGSQARWVLANDGSMPAKAADATVSGPPEALLLLLWQRVALEDPRLSVQGDAEVAARIVAVDLAP